MAATTYADSIDIIDQVCYNKIITTKQGETIMNITIQDKTPNTSTLELMMFDDGLETLLVVRGWA